MSKIKKTTQASVTLEQAEQAAQEFAQASNKLGTIEAAINEAAEKVRSQYKDEIVQLKNILDPKGEVTTTLEAYAIATKDTWDGRSIELTHARIGFRMGTPKVDTCKGYTLKVALDLLKANKTLARDYVRVKEEIDKKAILEADEKAKKVLEEKAKIIVVQDETFYVEEHKQQLA